MSVGSVSGIVAGASTDNDASILVARKALDVQKQQGDATIRLIESAKVEGQKGYNLDVVV
ncbi:MAG: YjfB family protein [Syntrophobacteraceae bacterium]